MDLEIFDHRWPDSRRRRQLRRNKPRRRHLPRKKPRRRQFRKNKPRRRQLRIGNLPHRGRGGVLILEGFGPPQQDSLHGLYDSLLGFVFSGRGGFLFWGGLLILGGGYVPRRLSSVSRGDCEHAGPTASRCSTT